MKELTFNQCSKDNLHKSGVGVIIDSKEISRIIYGCLYVCARSKCGSRKSYTCYANGYLYKNENIIKAAKVLAIKAYK